MVVIQAAARATRVEYSPLPLSPIGSLVFGAPPARTSVVECLYYPMKLSKSGLLTSMRFSFAFFQDFECNPDITPIVRSVPK